MNPAERIEQWRTEFKAGDAPTRTRVLGDVTKYTMALEDLAAGEDDAQRVAEVERWRVLVDHFHEWCRMRMGYSAEDFADEAGAT